MIQITKRQFFVFFFSRSVARALACVLRIYSFCVIILCFFCSTIFQNRASELEFALHFTAILSLKNGIRSQAKARYTLNPAK
jgi:hypothetical protein